MNDTETPIDELIQYFAAKVDKCQEQEYELDFVRAALESLRTLARVQLEHAAALEVIRELETRVMAVSSDALVAEQAAHAETIIKHGILINDAANRIRELEQQLVSEKAQ